MFKGKMLRTFQAPQLHPSCDSAVLDLGLAAALEVLNATVGGEPSGIPESDGILNTKLVLEGTERGGSVVGPVTPGASGQTILLRKIQTHKQRASNMRMCMHTSVNNSHEVIKKRAHTHTHTHTHVTHAIIPPGRTFR